MGLLLGSEAKEILRTAGDAIIDAKWEKRNFFYNSFINAAFGNIGFAQLILTRRCNIKCPNCNVPLSADYEMSLKEWKNIVRLLSDHVQPSIISITGGEPLLRKDDLVEIISDFTERDIPVSLNTNGLLLDETILRELRDAGLVSLAVSYDGIKPKSSSKVIENAVLAKYLGIDTTLQMTISDRNMHLAYDIRDIAFSHNLGFSPLVMQNLDGMFSSGAYDQPNEDFVRSFFSDVVNETRKFLTNNNYRNSVKYYEYIRDNYPRLWHCEKYNWLIINEDGRMMHCQEIAPSEFKLADILENPRDFVKYRQENAKDCLGCHYNCYFESENRGLGGLADLVKMDYRTRAVLGLRGMNLLSETIETKQL